MRVNGDVTSGDVVGQGLAPAACEYCTDLRRREQAPALQNRHKWVRNLQKGRRGRRPLQHGNIFRRARIAAKNKTPAGSNETAGRVTDYL